MTHSDAITGAWLAQDLSVVRNGAQLGPWPEVGTWIFSPTSEKSGHFSFTVQYMGDDAAYPAGMLKFLASSGTYAVDGNRLVTQTTSSSAVKRLGQSQYYEIAVDGNVLKVSAKSPDGFQFTTTHRRANA